MATDLTDVIKQGYMRCKSRSLGLWQKRWIVLRKSSSKGPCRLEKYINEYSARNLHQHKVQLLINVNGIDRISSNHKKHAFQIDFSDGSSKSFACESDLEADNWVKLTIQECFRETSGIANGEPDVLRAGIQKELQEQFKVYLMPSSKLELFGECLLQVTHENIYLWDNNNLKNKLCAWPLTSLRRYGSDLTKFTFEAGRHCATGEGMFIFHTLEGEKIYRKVHQATLAIAEAHQRMKKQFSAPSPCSTKELSSTVASNKNDYFFDTRFPTPSNDLSTTPLTEQHTSWYNSDNDDSTTISGTRTTSSLNSQVYNYPNHQHNIAMGLKV